MIIFHISSLFQAALAIGFISGCLFYLLYPDFLLLCVYFYCPAKTRPHTTSSSSPDLWYQIAGLRPASFFIFFPLPWSIQSQAETGEKGLVGTVSFPFYSHFYLFFLFVFFFPSRNLQCRFKNIWGVFLKILFWIKAN